MKRADKPRVVFTMGDPAGVGPEVAVRAAADRGVRGVIEPMFVGDAGTFADVARRLRVRLPGPVVEVSELRVRERKPGTPTREGATAAYRAIIEGVRLVRGRTASAIVTAPVNKASIRELGIDFSGHTELIARLAGKAEVRMMMVGPRLRVALATTHIPYAEVPAALTAARVIRTAEIAAAALERYFEVRRPRLALAGLNPHAGENGTIGDDERRRLAPAAERARRKGLRLEGPLPADTVFFRAANGEFDAVIALYHDQGLAPFKVLHFREGVNVTIGLPFPRTSPDHGTAYDRAPRRNADPTSMIAAAQLAARMCANGR